MISILPASIILCVAMAIIFITFIAGMIYITVIEAKKSNKRLTDLKIEQYGNFMRALESGATKEELEKFRIL